MMTTPALPTPSHDPYLWLENNADPAVQRWAASATAQTQQQLESDPAFAAISAAVLQTRRDQRQIPYGNVHGEYLYHFAQSAAQPLGIYRRCRVADYGQGQCEWQTLLDLDALSAAEGVAWQLAGVAHYVLQPERCLLSLSPGGGDACVVREFDLGARAFVADGFAFPLGKSQISWRDLDSLWVCPAWDEDQQTTAGYSRELVLYRRGQSWAQATSMLVLPEQVLQVGAWRFLAQGERGAAQIDLAEVALDLHRRSYFWLPECACDEEIEPIHLPLPPKAMVEAYSHGDLIVRLEAAWAYTDPAGQGYEFVAGSVVAVELDTQQGILGRAQLIFAPSPQQAVQMVVGSWQCLLLIVLDQVRCVAHSWRHAQGEWQACPNPLPTGGVLEIMCQPWQTDTIYYSYNDFLTPAAVYACELGAASPAQCLRQQPAELDPTDYQVQQCWATSVDGTQVPYFVVEATALAGQPAPTLLYAYGGFAVPQLPYYLDHLGPHWLAPGGRYVVANVRGGGEFGARWHQAALREQRQCSVDDVLAIMADLQAKGWLQAQQLALQGGSHGGWLVARTMQQAAQRADLLPLGAVVCEMPVLDLLRYPELGAGASWLAEYGNPAKPEQASWLAALSPYHCVQPASAHRYPPILLSTASDDDRVHPGHARKMAAALASVGQPVLFWESAQGGHGGRSGQQAVAADFARVMVFLRQQLGMSAAG
ncbi:prolyl oligopeptidase family serine peptidase [Chitinibacter sp. ZOR0017]|uniref:prolyl oligopeptidase family serine peptidase n=1 Tax=Chitinibacter sp. ZOR0017 TaxID=1339254 RepID=UPI001E53E940|nr:prolyl oligopeptidase family serine peptidase [Chitinibacter sp. ZOR0017]